MPEGARVREALSVCYGGVDSYDFHGLETIQCMVERRQGGESGVKWVQWFLIKAGNEDGPNVQSPLDRDGAKRQHDLTGAGGR